MRHGHVAPVFREILDALCPAPPEHIEQLASDERVRGTVVLICGGGCRDMGIEHASAVGAVKLARPEAGW